MSTRSDIETAARENGWRVSLNTPDALTLFRSGKHVAILFSVRGAVTAASTERRRITGTGKSQRILDILQHRV